MILLIHIDYNPLLSFAITWGKLNFKYFARSEDSEIECCLISCRYPQEEPLNLKIIDGFIILLLDFRQMKIHFKDIEPLVVKNSLIKIPVKKHCVLSYLWFLHENNNKKKWEKKKLFVWFKKAWKFCMCFSFCIKHFFFVPVTTHQWVL